MAHSVDSPLAFAAPEPSAPAVATGGHEDALEFADLYETYFEFVWRTAWRLGVPEASLDDIVQEVFVVVHRRFSERPDGAPLRGWLYAIVLNVTRNHRRAVQRSRVELTRTETDFDQTKPHPGPWPDESLARTEAIEALELILNALDEDKLEVFVLAELEQLSIPQIAGLLGLNVNTAYARLRAARQAFEEAITRHNARDGWRLR
jgi:RNA polymerase sigma-70 factor (ECF subfamily)